MPFDLYATSPPQFDPHQGERSVFLNQSVQIYGRSLSMLNKPLAAVLVVAAVFLSACEKNNEIYPVSGEQCGPKDPVQTLDADDCDILPAGI
ncbi:hypothetical protein [Ruegeria sp. Alg231-54]|uniref:hypothetical protein n=1 Tax=Ruegeria sp. Alg231-54 TaxID=1922221 RepID=UPI00131EFD8A|nr:hypothetical protein [Ruegeria sp. Alg231-54]